MCTQSNVYTYKSLFFILKCTHIRILALHKPENTHKNPHPCIRAIHCRSSGDKLHPNSHWKAIAMAYMPPLPSFPSWSTFLLLWPNLAEITSHQSSLLRKIWLSMSFQPLSTPPLATPNFLFTIVLGFDHWTTWQTILQPYLSKNEPDMVIFHFFDIAPVKDVEATPLLSTPSS